MDKGVVEQLSADELRLLSENDTSELRYDRYYVCELAFKKYMAEGKSSEADAMKMEVAAFQLSTHSSERRFSPLWTVQLENGEMAGFPDIEKDFPDNTIYYYRKRANETKNPILKARYCDLIWEKKLDHMHGREAVSAYLACWPLYLADGWERELVDALKRAMAISCMLKDQSLVDATVVEHFAAAAKMLEAGMVESIADIADSIVSNADKYSKPMGFDPVLEICERAIKQIGENQTDGYLFQRGLLEVITKIFKMRSEADKVTQTRVRIAESYVEEADWKKINYPTGNLVAASFYTDALKEYLEIGGFGDRINEIKLKIAEANKIGTETELKPIVTEIDLPVEPLKKHLQVYEDKTIKEIFYLMSIDNLLPSYQRAIDSAKKVASENSLFSMMPYSILKGNIRIKSIVGDEALLEFHAIHNYQLSYRTITARLLQMLFELVKTKSLVYLDDLSQYFSESEMINTGRIEIIKSGLTAYDREDYTSAFHVLIFQVEGVLRDFLAKLGLPTFSFRSAKSEMRERQLEDLLRTLSQVVGFDRDLAKFLEIFLCRIEADNFRNEAAHGLLTQEAFTRENCQLLLLCLIRLASYTVQTK